MNGAGKTGYIHVTERTLTKSQIKTLMQNGPDLNV